MKYFIILITILIALASCRSPQQIADRKCAKAQAKYEKAAYRWGCPLVQQSDTVYKQMIIRERHDTTITVTIPGETKYDSIKVVITNGVVNSEKSRLDTQYAYATAQVIDGILVLKLYQKPSEIEKTIKDAIQKDSHIEYLRITNTIKETTNILKWWQVTLMWTGGIFLLLLLLYILFVVVRKKYFII